MNNLVEDLPTKTKQGFKSAYDNIFEQGIEQGIEIGSKREAERKSVEIAIKSIREGLSDSLVLYLSEISKDSLTVLKKSLVDNFKTKSIQNELVIHLMEHFEYLRDKDIAEFSKLELEEIIRLREALKNKD